jgi:hypothetical protein
LGWYGVWVVHDGKEQMLDTDIAVTEVPGDLARVATILP